MTNETRSRIRAYTEELPHMREKVFGALLMLVIAACVAATSSYAWVTLSRSPEVSHIATSLAANGALEIALSKPDGSMPDEFDIDESVTGSSDVTVTNLQWGNLVNLSDASYGIDNMALRPAQLNTANLLGSPLWGASYGEDGRITKLNSGYTYAVFDGKQFMASKKYGVRAISSYVTKTSDTTVADLTAKIDAVTAAKGSVTDQYDTVIDQFSTLGALITRVAQDKVNSTDYVPDSEKVNGVAVTDSNLASHLPAVRDFYVEMEKAMRLQQDAYTALANLQLYRWTKSENQEFSAVTWNDLKTNHANYNAADNNSTSSNGIIVLTGLSQFVSDYNALKTDLSYLEKYVTEYQNNKAEYYWSRGGDSGYQIVDMINRLISYGTMYLIIDGEEVPVGSLQSKAVELVTSSQEDYDVYVKNGILQRFEQSALDETARMNGNAQCNITIKAQAVITMTLNIKGHAYSTATGSSYFAVDFAKYQDLALDAADMVAEDTYGLAIDLWVRTNAEQTCLTLEGATSTDEQGNIVSYDGINRVWGHTGEAMLTTNSTTQGGGSCYVYYADTPEDMARSLDLLDAMKVAFVDSTGNLLATAEMDTANYWAVNGRITVPLVLDNQTKTTYNYVDDMNAEQVGRAITTLYTDLPIRVTAIVYLDGTRLTNDHVLAAAEIQGSLNIQFGSSLDLKTLGSNELVDDTRSVSASVSPNELNYDTAKVEADMTTSITVDVEGVDPTNVTAFFVRAINSTQGTREPTMTFTKQADGTWTCDYKFTAPGTYYLRQVRLDGVDYTLADPQKVEVAGFGLNSVSWSETSENVTIQTSAGTHSTTVTVNFATNDSSKLPKTVQARFVRDDGNTVNVPLTYNANGNWMGTGTFSASGTYQLQYLVADGDRYIDLALTDGSYRTMDLSLGLYVSVTDLSGGLVQEFDEEEAEKGVFAKNVAVRVYNNAGVELEELEGLKLFYSNGSSLKVTINNNLEWDELNHYYTTSLPIVKPGRYQFAYVYIGTNMLTKCTASPTYIIISPDPPVYDEASACTLNNDAGIQFVPLTNDAKIDGIYITNAESASASAVVYSAVSNSYYEVAMKYSGTSWSIDLPTYDGEQTGTDSEGNPTYEAAQDGRWSVAAIYLWDCYAYDEWHESTNPVLWVDATLGQAYLNKLAEDSGETVPADETHDFSKLTTTVSTSFNVAMTAKKTTLGGEAVPFMTTFYMSELKETTYVTITDDDGNVIPSDKISNVKLYVSYTAPTETDKYGYKVLSGANKDYVLTLGGYDPETGYYINSTEYWQYVGEYTVTKLALTIGGTDLEYDYTDGIGVPEMYTVTTAGPGEDNITLTASQNANGLVLGKNGENVTGTFLQSYNIGSSTYATIGLVGVTGNNYVDMSDLIKDVALVMTYKNGKSAPNGGYTWSGNSEYENIELLMTNSDGIYRPGSTPLLAGTYSVKVVATLNDAEGTTIESSTAMRDVSVYSKLPDVTMALASGTPTTVTVNADAGTAVSDNTFTGTNTVVDNGHSAVLFASYRPFEAEENLGTYESYNQSGIYAYEFAHYEMPSLTFTLANGGTACTDFSIVIPNNEIATVALQNNSETDPVQIGSVETGTAKKDGTYIYTIFGKEVSDSCEYSYVTEKPDVIGTQQISTLTAKMGDDVYTFTLENELSIVQENNAVPSITFTVDNNSFMTPTAVYSEDGRSFTYTLPSLTTATGATSVVHDETETSTSTTTSGDDPDTKANEKAFEDTLTWETTETGTVNNVFTVTPTTKSSTHTHAWRGGTHYWKYIASSLYTVTPVTRTTTQDVSVSGLTTEVKTEMLYQVTTSLGYWTVDGKQYKPGDLVTVTGNSIATAEFENVKGLEQTTVTTTATDGTMHYLYEAICNATYTEYVGAGNYTEGTTTYCNTHLTCGHSWGDANSALKDTLAEPTNSGYTKVGSVTEGYVYDFTESKWERSGDPVVETGESTVNVTIYDANGVEISNKNYDSDGNLIEE